MSARLNESVNGSESSTLRRTNRVVVGVSGSPGSLAALTRAVQEARRRGHLLVPVSTWTPRGGEAAARRAPSPELDAQTERAAEEQLRRAIASALGGMPEDVPVAPTVVRGSVVDALVSLADHPGDLLVLGGGPRHPLVRLVRGGMRRQVTARAQAPVLLVPEPTVPRGTRRRLRNLTADDFRRGAADGLAA
ncbi:universal stress protein [Streptomyces sp. NPDC057654]|uniref:universal stress protein n=1 Tax=Streptomyces sp. NPDC057654 TaxID=3346196 RepID=UPI0036AEB668